MLDNMLLWLNSVDNLRKTCLIVKVSLESNERSAQLGLFFNVSSFLTQLVLIVR